MSKLHVPADNMLKHFHNIENLFERSENVEKRRE